MNNNQTYNSIVEILRKFSEDPSCRIESTAQTIINLIEIPKHTENPHKNPINELQELMQTCRASLPTYKFVLSDDIWSCTIMTGGITITENGCTKIEAKKRAAQSTLNEINGTD